MLSVLSALPGVSPHFLYFLYFLYWCSAPSPSHAISLVCVGRTISMRKPFPPPLYFNRPIRSKGWLPCWHGNPLFSLSPLSSHTPTIFRSWCAFPFLLFLVRLLEYCHCVRSLVLLFLLRFALCVCSFWLRLFRAAPHRQGSAQVALARNHHWLLVSISHFTEGRGKPRWGGWGRGRRKKKGDILEEQVGEQTGMYCYELCVCVCVVGDEGLTPGRTVAMLKLIFDLLGRGR